MSIAAWAVQTMKKYQLTVCFHYQFVETVCGYEIYWGEREECSTFEDALQQVVDHLVDD